MCMKTELHDDKTPSILGRTLDSHWPVRKGSIGSSQGTPSLPAFDVTLLFRGSGRLELVLIQVSLYPPFESGNVTTSGYESHFTPPKAL